jgi:hypothetical protein
MSSGFRDVVEDHRVNAALAWLLTGLLVVAVVVNAAGGDLVEAAFPLALVVLALVPAVALRTPRAMLPWEVLAVAAVPVIVRTLVAGQRVGAVTLSGRITTYFAVAAVALMLAVELDVFTPVRMNRPFAVLFVAVTTAAAAGLWALLKWSSDVYLGTTLMLDGRPERVVEQALMWDFVAATVAGVGAGALFDYYFRRRDRAARRVLDEEVRA